MASLRSVHFADADADAAARSRRQDTFLEEELFYVDRDHRHAHGYGDAPDSLSFSSGVRARRATFSLMPQVRSAGDPGLPAHCIDAVVMRFHSPASCHSVAKMSESVLFTGSLSPPIEDHDAPVAAVVSSAAIATDSTTTDSNKNRVTLEFVQPVIPDTHVSAAGAETVMMATDTAAMAAVETERKQTELLRLPTCARSAPFSRSERLARKRRSSVDDSSVKPRRFLINVEETKRAILAQEDTDGDFQITIHDAGPKSFAVGTANSGGFKKFEIRGTYALSNLLQELALASEYGRKTIILDEARLTENPVERMTRLIKFHFWDALTRRIDADGLEKICQDPKDRSDDQRNRVYVPFHDSLAFKYYERVAAERPHLNLDVVRLPEVITPEYVRSINNAPGILSLALREQYDPRTGQTIVRGAPFVVPGGRFNEMYGWDSYFEALGLLADGRVELARGMVENFCYEIEHYGKILNANRSYYLTRSQPPFLTDMVVQVHARLAQKMDWTSQSLRVWLSRGVRASIKEHLSVWKASPRLDAKTGLSKYYPEGIGMPPETESTHFDHIILPYAKMLGLTIEEYATKYNSGEIREPELDAYFIHDRAVRESGHDTTYRFEKRCANLATIDLNALVYKYEVDLADLISSSFGGVFEMRVRRGPDDIYWRGFQAWMDNLVERGGPKQSVGNHGGWESVWAKGICVFDETMDAKVVEMLSREQESADPPVSVTVESSDRPWLPTFDPPGNDDVFFTVRMPSALFRELSEHSNELISKYLWCPYERMFFDWDCALHERSVYETVTCLWALWAGCASKVQAEQMRSVVFSKFEVVGGLVSGTEESRGAIGIDRPNRQWDYPFGWAPHQILAWSGLAKYGFHTDAQRLSYRWLYTLTKSFVDFNGVVPEKFDVVNMTHKVDVEYGNVGANFRLVVKEGFGWMNASYQLGLPYLTQYMRRALGTLTQPDQLFRKLQI